MTLGYRYAVVPKVCGVQCHAVWEPKYLEGRVLKVFSLKRTRSGYLCKVLYVDGYMTLPIALRGLLTFPLALLMLELS